jgi:hypothetical protein
MKELRLVFKMLLWTVVTLVLGLGACIRGVQFALRLPEVLRKEMCCPRGHRVALYGTFGCGRCGAQYEGWAFAPCPSCGALARHVPCPRCGLTIRDPLS